MRRKLVLFLSLLVVFGLTIPSLADHKPGHPKPGGGGKGGGNSVGTPVEITLRNLETDRIRSDGFGPYAGGDKQVRAEILTDLPFRLVFNVNDSKNPALRTLFVDFSECVSDTCNPPFEMEFAETEMTITLVDPEGLEPSPDGWFGMELNQSLAARLTVDFTLEDVLWIFRFRTDVHDDTDFATVTCLAVNADGQCDSWEVEAFSDDEGKLIRNPLKGRPNQTDQGNFFMPFRMTVGLK